MINEKEFRNYLDRDNDSAIATMNAYVSDMKEFESYLQENGKWISVCESADIQDFLMHLKDQGRSGSTINRKMVSIRKYFEYLKATNQIESNPCVKIRVPKVKRKDPDFLSVEQIEALLNQPDDSPKGIRDRALLELMYACGLKASEVSELNVQDVDLRIGFISCRGDKTKSRIIPMGKPARAAILNYMKDVRQVLLADNRDTGALFLNYSGQRISRQGIWKLIKFYGQKSGVSEDLNPQIIRNSFAAHMIMNGADLKSLQELLGNEDVSTVKLFMSLAKARVMDVYDKTHPRA
ncbi:MAG: tyrosine-type recombinase/integrase [Bacillota bacterium]|nr:tyrosine-type recombinase/integrase [Bacillota bacterium]